MFLDIVDSTDQLAAMGDERWRSILEQLDVSVDRRVAGFGGQRVWITRVDWRVSQLLTRQDQQLATLPAPP